MFLYYFISIFYIILMLCKNNNIRKVKQTVTGFRV
jgi:hypothetical protein